MAHATTQGATLLSRAIRRNAAALSACVRRAARGDAGGIHRLRVVTRRLRQALRPVRDAGDIADQLRRLGKSLGPVRELDVARDVLAVSAERESWPVQTVARVDEWCRESRARAFDDARRVLEKCEPKVVARRLRAIADAADAAPRAVSHGGDVRKAARALTTAIDDAGTLYAPSALHEVRIAAKKLRYSVELFGESERGTLRRLRALQSVLGSMHDLQVLQQSVQEVATNARDLDEMTTLSAMARTIDATCRGWHAKALRRLPGIRTLVVNLAASGIVPREIGRPSRMAAAARPDRGRRRRTA